MRGYRGKMIPYLLAGVGLCLLLTLCSPRAGAQTLTTGSISGTVTDPSGGVVPQAVVTVSNEETGATRTTATGTTGNYVVGLLNPGRYKVTVKAAGFRTAEQSGVTVAVSQAVTVNLALVVGQAVETVEVVGEGQLIQTDNPNTTTTVNAESIANLPNPGSDLSYAAQIAPGAIMNTSGGYGNVEFNGLPAVSNNFTIDGLDANDPFLNLNNSGATNLQLGLDAIAEVSVNTTSYAVDQGRLGASQINYVTKSGTNHFHGKVSEIWNGSALNSTNYFIKASQYKGNPSPGQKPRSNVNEFGANVGGPIVKDKLFFFADLEGTRIVVPVVQHTTVPSQYYQGYVLQQLPVGGADTVFGMNLPAEPAEVSLYQNMFKLYGNTNGTPVAELGCPFDVGGVPAATANDGTGCANQRTFSQANHTFDTLLTFKVDHTINSRNSVWYRFQREKGTQATYTDPINPIFNAISIQPQYSAQSGFTHTFSPTLVNQFNPGFTWYSAIFQEPNIASTLQQFPVTYGYGPFTNMGGVDFVWPQGRNITQWQLNDNLSWTHGRHEVKIGENLRRVLVSDHDFGFFNTPLMIPCDLPEFTFGATCFTLQNFPRSLDEPFGIVNLDTYAMDSFKATSKLTVTLGIRATWNSDPVNQQNLMSRLKGSFYTTPHDPNRPLNQDIQTGLKYLFPATHLIVWQPRGAIAYQVQSNTVFRAGIGLFSDIFPASLSDSLASNPPYVNAFTAGLFGSLANGGVAIAPGVPNSAYDAAVAANQAFLSGFSSGAASCVATNPPANCLPTVNLTAVPDGTMKYPYFLQWSAGLEHEFTNNLNLQIQYVGTRSVDLPYTEAPNGFQTTCAGCWAPWADAPADPRFGGVTQYHLGAGSNYHGLQITGQKRMSHGLQFMMNYTYSHCLDEVSNGGIFGFGGPNNFLSPLPGELRRQYGPCDYDIRHSLNGSYVYDLPFHSSRGWLNQFVGGWQVAGDIVLHTGLPFSMQSSTIGGSLVQTSGPAYATLIPGQPLYAKQPIANVTQPVSVQWLNPNAFLSVVDSSTQECVSAANPTVEGISPSLCQFGDMQRNFLRAPGFRWGDIFVTKRFKLSEKTTLRLDGQFYNAFNHPNFGFPGASAGVPGVPATLTGFGAITGTAAPPTGLLGSFLGGDSSVRMIALQARIDF